MTSGFVLVTEPFGPGWDGATRRWCAPTGDDVPSPDRRDVVSRRSRSGLTGLAVVLSLLLSGVDQLYAFLGVFIAFGLVLFLPTRGDFDRPDELEAEAYENGHREANARSERG